MPPTSPPAPRLPSTFTLTPTHYEALCALLSTIYPRITVTSELSKTPPPSHLEISPATLSSWYQNAVKARVNPPSEAQFAAFLDLDISNDDAIISRVVAALATAPPDDLAGIKKMLELLASRAGTLLLCNMVTPFTKATLAARQKAMKGWQTSWVGPKRLFLRSICTIATMAISQVSKEYHDFIGYSDVEEGWKPAVSYPYVFEKPPVDEEEVLHYGVVIVGSGPGAGPAAATLSEKTSVLVLEKSRYWSPDHFPMTGPNGDYHLFENHGSLTSIDGSILMLAGSNFGGGGTINWGVSLRTPDYIVRTWAQEDELPLFASDRFGRIPYDSLMSEVLDQIDATTDYNIGTRDSLFLSAAEAENIAASKLKLNVGANSGHWCGRCHFGCSKSLKRGPAVAWFPKAAENGAKFMTGFEVEKVVFETVNGKKTATGVVGVYTADDGSKRTVRIKADRVIVSAGSLWSPVILRKSGLENPNIGKNLHLHPCAVLLARYDQEIIPWEGPIMSVLVNEWENCDKKGHGARLESCNSLPFIANLITQYTGLPDQKAQLTHLPTISPIVSFARDVKTGSVKVNPKNGRPAVDYHVDSVSAGYILGAIIATARMLLSNGATEIRVTLLGVPDFIKGEGDWTDRFDSWAKIVRKAYASKGDSALQWVSAHQMGTCRMSNVEGKGVVNGDGKVYGVENLYVSDASVLPSSSGVNPMVSIMSISLHISRGIADALQKST